MADSSYPHSDPASTGPSREECREYLGHDGPPCDDLAALDSPHWRQSFSEWLADLWADMMACPGLPPLPPTELEERSWTWLAAEAGWFADAEPMDA